MSSAAAQLMPSQYSRRLLGCKASCHLLLCAAITCINAFRNDPNVFLIIHMEYNIKEFVARFRIDMEREISLT